jgi:hypothetical protein
MCFSLSVIFFNIHDLKKSNIQYYFAHIVWKTIFAQRLKNDTNYLNYYLDFINKFLFLYGCERKIENIRFFKVNSKIFSMKLD